MKNDLRKRLGREWLFCDGGTGTILQAKGLKGGELPETWNLTRPEDIIELHAGYLAAGSDIINTNTFGANSLKFNNLNEIISAAVGNVREAMRRTGREDAYVALDIGPTGKMLPPVGDLPFERAVEIFGEVVRLGVAAGVDLVLIETMNDPYEAKAAVVAAKENCDLPVLATMAFNQKEKLTTGGDVDSAVALLEGLHVDALGVNCGMGPRQMAPIVRRMAEISSLPIIVNPNAGLPRSENGRTVFDVGPEEFAEEIFKMASECPVQVFGGCCGTTPEHIVREVAAVRKLPFCPATEKARTVISSFSHAVEIGQKPIIIGERINPTGKKKFKEALRKHDVEYILQQGIDQEGAGAHVLDVNVGLPEIDEPAMMEEIVTRLQSVLTLPLQIDTSNQEALERGMRHYNGKPMVNSVNGKQEVIEQVFPLVAKYGGVLVALMLDEQGIPDNADGRIAIAKRIYEAADRYGVPRKDIVIDCLAMTISSDPRSALVTLETLRRVRDELHGNTILGVSNISFGLPMREIVNAHFLTMALQNGLSCAIINPNNAAMMASYRAFCALAALDSNCAEYIEAYANATPGTSAPTVGNAPKTTGENASGSTLSLGEAVARGVTGRAAEATRELLQSGRVGMDIINEELVPALDRVGQGYEKGTVFLPQLLMSAEAAQAAFAVIKETLQGNTRQAKGRIILATVKGDIHDIGKNIVKVMLENYGYEVLDLGKDVPPERIVQTAIDEKIRLIGLSALMTTTVVSMAETIKLLREKGVPAKVVVGGAVLTQKYADSIGADCYARDAMETVRYANRIFLSQP
ncbi:MAG: homocysteine S-methyltransferase family protein [Victivallales bacterium]|nr:homocysteine S-methyltransferase family protein [Victivallales bacterium]